MSEIEKKTTKKTKKSTEPKAAKKKNETAKSQKTRTFVSEVHSLMDIAREDKIENIEFLLKHLPEAKMTEEFCCEIVQREPDLLRRIPAKKRTEKACQIAVTGKGAMVKYVPRHHLTKNIMLTAVKKDPNAVNLIPQDVILKEPFFSKVLVDIALDKDPQINIAEGNEKGINEDRSYVYREAIRKNPELITEMPQEMITDALVVESLKHGKKIKTLPEWMINENVITNAVKCDGMILAEVDKKYITRELVYAAIRENGYAAQFAPFKYQTIGLYTEAVKSTPGSIKDVPKEKMTPEMIMKAVEADGDLLKYVPKQLIDRPIAMRAVVTTRTGNALRYIPKSLQDQGLVMEAVKRGASLEHVSEMKKSKSVCLEAVKRDAENMEYIPEAFRTIAFALEAMQENPDVFMYMQPIQKRECVKLLSKLFKIGERKTI